MKCGCVGLPNVGKSTLFNALMKKQIADAQNYPFCTIEPNSGSVAINDSRLDELSKISQSKKIIPTTLECIDIAGLVKGASKGEGKGNAFLSHIRQVDLIIHVIRCFENENITHVENDIDPIRDINLIETELILADMEILERWKHKRNVVEYKKEFKIIDNTINLLNDGKYLYFEDISQENLIWLRQLGLITTRPMFFVANVDSDSSQNEHFLKVQQYALSKNISVVPVQAKFEAECIDFTDEEIEELAPNHARALNTILKTGYDILQLQTYFTSGEKETRAWTIKKGTLAPQAAGKIHTDFERGFISADVLSYDNFIKYRGWSEAKKAGKVHLAGRSYEVQNGDVMLFKFNV